MAFPNIVEIRFERSFFSLMISLNDMKSMILRQKAHKHTSAQMNTHLYFILFKDAAWNNYL